jgi:mRNA deadenylase 3'-5' endonuclease subunit Ccr4
LQEVETEQFYNFFQPELRRDGYEGVFSPKSRAKTMNEVERKHVDGCAIFYRLDAISGNFFEKRSSFNSPRYLRL